MSRSRVDEILFTVMSGDRESSTLPELLCEACAGALPVSGVGMALVSPEGHQGVVAATNGVARAMEDLQFTMGEGPCIDASRDGSPVLQPDFSRTGQSRWPGFGPAVVDAGVRAIFAFPLQAGAIRLGVLDLYRDLPGNLDDAELSEALAFAEAATVVLLHLQDQMPPGEGVHPQLTEAWGSHAEIHQATGIISVQAAIGMAEALLLLRARAFSIDRTALAVARDVVARTLHFYPDDHQHD